jgi:hypothetical protein
MYKHLVNQIALTLNESPPHQIEVFVCFLFEEVYCHMLQKLIEEPFKSYLVYSRQVI